MRIEERRDGRDERRVLTAMIVSDAVAGRIAARWAGAGRDGPFRSPWANLVGGWAVDYARRYRRAPRRAIESIFDAWADNGSDPDTVRVVDRFLAGLSDEYESNGEAADDYVIDLAGRLFNRVRLARLADGIKDALDRGDDEGAEHQSVASTRIELGTRSGVDVFQDEEALRRAFAERSIEPLVRYRGPLGEFLSPALGRDCFVALTAPAKRTKSFWLMDLAWRSSEQRRRTAYFVVGDMSEEQVQRRLSARAARCPYRPPLEARWPTAIRWEDGMDVADVDYEGLRWDDVLEAGEAWAAYQRHQRRRIRSRKPFLRLHVSPVGGVGVAGLRDALLGWDRDGWTAEVVVVDYADNLAPPPGIKEGRDRINENWRQLRALSQEWHCLLATATQADAASYGARLVRRQNFSDDRRKHDHVTAMIGINMTDEEKVRGVCRLNYIDLREGDFAEGRVVHVAGCLALGQPAVVSCF